MYLRTYVTGILERAPRMHSTCINELERAKDLILAEFVTWHS